MENEEYEEVICAMGLTGFPLLMAQYLAKTEPLFFKKDVVDMIMI